MSVRVALDLSQYTGHELRKLYEEIEMELSSREESPYRVVHISDRPRHVVPLSFGSVADATLWIANNPAPLSGYYAVIRERNL